MLRLQYSRAITSPFIRAIAKYKVYVATRKLKPTCYAI